MTTPPTPQQILDTLPRHDGTNRIQWMRMEPEAIAAAYAAAVAVGDRKLTAAAHQAGFRAEYRRIHPPNKTGPKPKDPALVRKSHTVKANDDEWAAALSKAADRGVSVSELFRALVAAA